MSYSIKDAERNAARNNALDRAMQGAGAAALVALAGHDLVKHIIRAPHPLQYVLAGGAIAFLIYVIVAPLFRR